MTPLLTYRGMTVGRGAQFVADQLTIEQIQYAGSIERGIDRGFAALHDKCDANMLLPFAETFTNSTKQTEFYNAIMAEVTEYIIEQWNNINDID